jgi:hypothetical protein
MGVVRAPIQTVDDIYQLVWTSVKRKQPIEASYDGRLRLLCPHRLGRNSKRELRGVLCCHYGDNSRSRLEQSGSPANWRCMVVEKLRQVRLLAHAWQNSAEPFPSNVLRS